MTVFLKKYWFIAIVPLAYVYFIFIGYVFMTEFGGDYTEKYEVEMSSIDLLNRIDSIIDAHPEYGQRRFVRYWAPRLKIPKSERKEYNERLLFMGSGKDTVWVRLMLDSISPNLTMLEVMDVNRKIKKNGIWYLWTHPVNTYDAGLIRSYKIRKELQTNFMPMLNVKWVDRTSLLTRMGPFYTYTREWFLDDILWIDAPKKRNKKNSEKSLKYENTNDSIKNEK